MRGRDHAHAWAILLVEIGQDRALDIGTDLGPAELLSLAPGPPQAGTHPLLDHGPLELGLRANVAADNRVRKPPSTLVFPDSSISSEADEIDHLNAPRFAASAHLAISLLRNSPSFSGGPATKR
jgi:hypothetical protein